MFKIIFEKVTYLLSGFFLININKLKNILVKDFKENPNINIGLSKAIGNNTSLYFLTQLLEFVLKEMLVDKKCQKRSTYKEYKNKRGERLFKFHLYLGLDANGKRVNITRQGFPNYNEAKTTYDQLRANGTQGYQKP